MSVTRVVAVILCLAGSVATVPLTVAAQETTFIALGSDPDEVVGHGSNTYFDATTADFTVNRSSGVNRQFITILIRPKDGSPVWSMGFTTEEHASALVGARHYATETPGFASAEIGIAAPGVSCGRRVGSFIIHELRLALPAHEGFAATIDFDARCAGASGGLYGQVRIYSSLTGTNVGDLGMSALSPVAPGTPLRFAVETDSSVPLEFKFIRYQVSTGQWTVIQDYSFRPVWSWTPTVGDLDDYYLQVWIRARGSTNSSRRVAFAGPLHHQHFARLDRVAHVGHGGRARGWNHHHLDRRCSRRLAPARVSVRQIFVSTGAMGDGQGLESRSHLGAANDCRRSGREHRHCGCEELGRRWPRSHPRSQYADRTSSSVVPAGHQTTNCKSAERTAGLLWPRQRLRGGEHNRRPADYGWPVASGWEHFDMDEGS